MKSVGARTTRAVAAPASGSRRTPLVTTTHARRVRLCYGTRRSQLPTRAPPPPLTARSFSRRSRLGDARRAAPGPPDGHLLKTDMSRMSGGARLRPLLGTRMMPSAAVSNLRRGHKTNATRGRLPGDRRRHAPGSELQARLPSAPRAPASWSPASTLVLELLPQRPIGLRGCSKTPDRNS